jgi:hypothetical protein
MSNIEKSVKRIQEWDDISQERVITMAAEEANRR